MKPRATSDNHQLHHLFTHPDLPSIKNDAGETMATEWLEQQTQCAPVYQHALTVVDLPEGQTEMKFCAFLVCVIINVKH